MAMRAPKAVSDRSKSAVNLKGIQSHRSENMVTFMEQSYTETGEQKWTFNVLKKLTVHVYTGKKDRECRTCNCRFLVFKRIFLNLRAKQCNLTFLLIKYMYMDQKISLPVASL